MFPGGGPEPGEVGTGFGLTFGLGAVTRGAGGRTPFVPGDEPAAPAWLHGEGGWNDDRPEIPEPAPLFDDFPWAVPEDTAELKLCGTATRLSAPSELAIATTATTANVRERRRLGGTGCVSGGRLRSGRQPAIDDRAEADERARLAVGSRPARDRSSVPTSMGAPRASDPDALMCPRKTSARSSASDLPVRGAASESVTSLGREFGSAGPSCSTMLLPSAHAPLSWIGRIAHFPGLRCPIR